MSYSPQHKEQSRQRILQAAALLFCSKGFDRVTLSQIMKQANMTHGAFYAHFSGKSSLYEAALKFATAKSFWARSEKDSEAKDTHLKALITRYLSWSRPDTNKPSPLEFLVTDAAHKDEKVRQTYQDCFENLVTRLATILAKRGTDNPQILAEETVVSLVGTVSVARSITDPLREEFVKRAQARILQRLNQEFSLTGKPLTR